MKRVFSLVFLCLFLLTGCEKPEQADKILYLPQLLLSGRFCKATCCPQPPLQQHPYDTTQLAFSTRLHCPKCLTNLHRKHFLLAL